MLVLCSRWAAVDLGTAANHAFVHTCDRQQCPIPPHIVHTVLLVYYGCDCQYDANTGLLVMALVPCSTERDLLIATQDPSLLQGRA